MTDTTMRIKDAALADRNRAVKVDGAADDLQAPVTPYNAEDPAQRTALLAKFDVLTAAIVGGGLGPSGVVAVTGTVTPTDIASSPGGAPVLIGPFVPTPGRPFNITIGSGVGNATATGVMAAVQRQFPGSSTRFVKYDDEALNGLPETFVDSEPEAGVAYYVSVADVDVGTLIVRLSH